MWEIIIDWVVRILTKDTVETVTDDIVKDEFEDITTQTLQKREMLKSKSHSLFSIFKHKKIDFRKWLRETPAEVVKEKILPIIRKVLKLDDVSDRMIQKTQAVWSDENGVKTALHTDRQFPYEYHYLSATRHSDFAIWRTRALYYSSNEKSVNIGITFDIGGIEYRYYHVPLFVYYTMLIIPLTYVTKNRFIAGAYNYFWYSWWYKQPENTLMANKDLRTYAKKFRFLNKGAKLRQEIKDKRMKKLKGTKWVKTKGKQLIPLIQSKE